jgi:glycogen synthase
MITRAAYNPGSAIKLLIYSHFFAPSIGGVETVVLSLARGLSELRTEAGKAEFEVTVVTQTPAGQWQDSQQPFQVIRQPTKGELWKLIGAADALHVAGTAIGPMALGILARKPVFVEHHGFQAICPTGQLLKEPENQPCPGHFMAGRDWICLQCSESGDRASSFRLWILTFLRRFLCRRVTVNLVPTEWLGRQLHLPRTIAVPHGLPEIVPVLQISPAKAVSVLLFMGRLVSTKGVQVLLEAARVLHDKNRAFEMHIIGEGPERRTLEESAKTLQLQSKVRFLGRLAPEDLPEALGKADAVIVPSLGGEVFGMVVAENMARSVPVIASDLGAFVEVLGEDGETFRTGDSQDLASKLARVLDDRSTALAKAGAARLRILELFTMGRMIEGHAALYRGAGPGPATDN